MTTVEEQREELSREICYFCAEQGCDTCHGPNPAHDECKQDALLKYRAERQRLDA